MHFQLCLRYTSYSWFMTMQLCLNIRGIRISILPDIVTAVTDHLEQNTGFKDRRKSINLFNCFCFCWKSSHPLWPKKDQECCYNRKYKAYSYQMCSLNI